MRIDIIRQPLGLTFVLVTALLVLFWSREGAFLMSVEQISVPTGPLGTWFDNLISPYGRLRTVLACTALFLTAFQITRIVTRNMVLVVRTYQPALFFILVSCGFFLPQSSLSIALAAFLVSRGAELMIAGFQRRATYDKFFRAGLVLGLAPLFFAPAIISFPMLIGGVIFFRRGWRETIVGIAAFALPFATYSYAGWMSGAPFDVLLWLMTDALTRNSGFDLWADAGIARLAATALLAVLTVLSIATFTIHMKQMRTRPRRVLSYFIWVLALCAGCFFLPCASPADWTLLAVPVAVIAPNYFVRYRGIVPALLYLLLLFEVIGIDIASFFGYS